MGIVNAEGAFLDMGNAVEYFFTDIGKIENAGGDCLRFYCCAKRGNILEVRFVAVLPMVSVIPCARLAIAAVADIHNDMTFEIPTKLN